MRQPSPNSIRGCIQRALEAATMKDAGFNQIFPDGPLPTTEEEVTEFIKKRTEIYRRTWIIKPLEQALSKLEKKKNV